jgi:hypothetical protein
MVFCYCCLNTLREPELIKRTSTIINTQNERHSSMGYILDDSDETWRERLLKGDDM